MPRRRASKNQPHTKKGKKSSSIRKWDKREDIPFDEVDQFHEQRDKILLEDGEDEADNDYDDDEVFALKGLAESSEEELGEEEEREEDEDEDTGEPPSEPPKKKTKSTKKKTKGSKATKAAESSEDELADEDEEEESWGHKKSAYYSSNAAQIESDDEEAQEMEEQEARRLQAKLRAPMREEDFGYGEALQRAVDVTPVDDFWKPVEKPTSVVVGNDRASILRHLEKTSPETLALAFEWEDTATSVMKTEKKIAEMADDKENKTLGLIHVHHQTQLTYAALLAFYLHLRTFEKYAARPDLLRAHPILKRLLILKQSLFTFEELNFNASDSEDSLDSEEDLDLDEDDSDLDDLPDELETWLSTRKRGLDLGELEALLSEAGIPTNGKAGPKSHPQLKPKTRMNPKAEQPPKKKQKGTNGKAVPKITFDVEEPTLPSSRPAPSSGSTVKRASTAESFGFGEATTLDEADVADKNIRRKALRFHTAKIESASARRQGARQALGGDDDVPYRERKKGADKKNSKANLGKGGEDLDDAEPEPRGRDNEARKRMRDEGSDDEGASVDDADDGYYSLVKKQKNEKKLEKKAQYEATKEANRVDYGDDTITGHQRSVSRAILTNKGLTPKRSKSVRNPRVKKRQRFEKAKKKLASQKAVYKGGIGDPNHYGGETSGISKVVKSIKL